MATDGNGNAIQFTSGSPRFSSQWRIVAREKVGNDRDYQVGLFEMWRVAYDWNLLVLDIEDQVTTGTNAFIARLIEPALRCQSGHRNFMQLMLHVQWTKRISRTDLVGTDYGAVHVRKLGSQIVGLPQTRQEPAGPRLVGKFAGCRPRRPGGHRRRGIGKIDFIDFGKKESWRPESSVDLLLSEVNSIAVAHLVLRTT